MQLEVDISGFPSVMAHYKRMQERASVKKLLAYEKEVNEGLPRRPRRVTQAHAVASALDAFPVPWAPAHLYEVPILYIRN